MINASCCFSSWYAWHYVSFTSVKKYSDNCIKSSLSPLFFIFFIFDRLKARGKHTTSAQIAVMRKIVTITYSLYKMGTIYDEKRYEKWNNLKIAS